MTKDDARRIAANVAKLAEFGAKMIVLFMAIT